MEGMNMKSSKYLLDDGTIDEIIDLCESLVLAISKTIRRAQITKNNLALDPDIKRYKQEIQRILSENDEQMDFNEIF